jgi:hypothetical protein
MILGDLPWRIWPDSCFWEEREEESEPEPEVSLAAFVAVPLVDLAALAAAFFLGAAVFLVTAAAFLVAGTLVFFNLVAATAFFLVTPAVFVRGPGAFSAAGGAGGGLDWICKTR